MGAGNRWKISLPVVLLLGVCALLGCGSGGDKAEQGNAALAHYRSYLLANAALLTRDVRALKADIEAGNIAGARASYVRARYRYGRVKPLAASFVKLDLSIDPHFSLSVDRFIGFHRIERALWAGGGLRGTDAIAAQLLRAVERLKLRLSKADLKPPKLMLWTHHVVDEIFSVGLIGLEEAYSHLDLVDVVAKLEGIRAAFDAVKPLLGPESEVSKQVETRLRKLEATMEGLRTPAGLPRFEQLSFTEVGDISSQLETLEPILAQAKAQLS